MIERIEKVDDQKIKIIDRLAERCHDYHDLFCPSTAEMVVPHRTFDHAIDRRPDILRPSGPIHPLSQKLVQALSKYLNNMLK